MVQEMRNFFALRALAGEVGVVLELGSAMNSQARCVGGIAKGTVGLPCHGSDEKQFPPPRCGQ